ncbi:arylamine N-acetyltransferase [Verrucomicrobium sp. BvORR106]|uniref:arylamine N-acetyltransferase family protein n=1 Tax=Verrucomicrobium sp. BvORR106 TaxID=1403819 RepID=UPI0009DD280F|nr:arylamine N-acetyltransferase [Verrucomicrobium sp. BvORR106]
MTADSLSTALLGRVLDRLEIDCPSSPTPEALREVYAAWCRSVPFDNALKLTHVRAGKPGPLPGGEAGAFFDGWLRYGTGGTCWSSAGALQSLLQALGFDAIRGVATMMAAPDLPPNHGTVIVTLEGARFLVDSALLHVQPLELKVEETTQVEHGAWGCRSVWEDGRWHIHWRPVHQPQGLVCRLESWGATGDDYRARYEGTLRWSPFNYSLYIRTNRGEESIGLAFGSKLTLHADGRVSEQPIRDVQHRNQVLVEDFGLAEEVVNDLPEDQPLPPPPGSRSAQEAEKEVAST